MPVRFFKGMKTENSLSFFILIKLPSLFSHKIKTSLLLIGLACRKPRHSNSLLSFYNVLFYKVVALIHDLFFDEENVFRFQ